MVDIDCICGDFFCGYDVGISGLVCCYLKVVYVFICFFGVDYVCIVRVSFWNFVD